VAPHEDQGASKLKPFRADHVPLMGRRPAWAAISHVDHKGTLMTTMVSEVYDALKSAGAPEGEAHAAAAAVAEADVRLDRLETRARLQSWLTVGLFVLVLLLYAQPFWAAY
jgi:hypothetical protein